MDRIRFFLMFYRQPDAAYFDELMMTFDETGSAYTYDSNGNLISASDNAQRNEAYNFNNANELTQFTNENNETYKYFYNQSDMPHRLTAARSQQRGNGFVYTYTAPGVPLQTLMGTVKEDGTLDYTKPYMSSSQLYNINSNYVNSYQDPRGNITSYNVDADNGLVYSITNPKGVTTNYTYNDSNYLTSVSATASQGVMHTVGYTYDDYWRLKKITHNGFDYEFTYDKWGNVTSTSAGGHTLSTNTYAVLNGNLTKTTYGNGDYIEYTYDNYDRITAKKVNGTVTEEYIYNSKGQTARCIDHEANLTYEYSYDLIGRLIEVRRSDNVSFAYKYDNLNRLTQKTLYINGEKHYQNYSYIQDNLLYAADFSSGASNLRLYDSLNRITNLNTLFPGSGIAPQNKLLMQQFGYESVSGQRTSPMVNNHSISFNLGSATQNFLTDSYSYDDNSNISSISRLKNGQTKNLSYEYDGLDQLIRVNDQKANATTLYTYDAGGNITSAKTYPYTTGSVSGSPLSQKTYFYSSSGWKDLLTNFNGDSIIYDEIGNPTRYRDGMNTVWESGRRLASITQGTNSYSYSYDSSGVRISKTVNGTTYTYIYDNGQLIYADTPVGSMTFFYENHSVAGYKYGPEYYYYIKNLQGDIIGVIDKNCNLLYQYEYDAWGNHTVLDAQGNTISPDAPHVANFNPLRYRGYFFDTETGLYLTGSRYYDPVTCRFINADTATVLTASPDSLYDKNLFAYCDNNPIMRADNTGEFWNIIVGAVFGAGIELASQLISGKSLSEVNWTKVGISAASGALTAATGPIAGSLISGATDVAIDAIDGNINSVGDAVKSFVGGTTKAAISYGVSSAIGKATKSITKIEKVGKIGKNGYPGVKYSYNKGPNRNRAIRSIELHPNHNGHGIHLQGNKWNPITGARVGVFFRKTLWR